MAYDGARFADFGVAAPAVAQPRDLYRSEGFSLLTGGVALGGLAGGFAAIALGNQSIWVIILASAPFLTLALFLSSDMLVDALRCDARGCAAAAGVHAASLLAWPFTSLFTPLSSYAYFTAPVVAVATLILFASCWNGTSRATYRAAAQGAVVALVSAYQGVIVLMAN